MRSLNVTRTRNNMLEVTITSPEQCFISSKATHISLPGTEGDFEIHPNHCAFISLLKIGEVTVHLADAEPMVLFINGGIVEISQDASNKHTAVSVLVDSAHHARLAEQEKLEGEQRQARRDLQNTEKVNYHALLKQLSQLSAELRTIEKARRYRKQH